MRGYRAAPGGDAPVFPSPSAAAQILAIARRVDAERAATFEAELAPLYPAGSRPELASVLAAAVLVSVAYPALAPAVRTHPREVEALCGPDVRVARTRADFLSLGEEAVAGDVSRARGERGERASLGEETRARDVRKGLRAFARRERVRIALREVMPRALGGADVDVTSRELAWLADATIEIALREATAWAEERYGSPIGPDGMPSCFVVLGMGKLGGEELNAGSDVDLIYFYDSDEGRVIARGGGDSAPSSMTLHEYWQRVARRLTATIEDVTEDGYVWRVDLRLRPEGASGPLVNSLAAAERYYESFGRLWERAAMLRARPVAGDLGLGDRLLEALGPFVWRKRIDPSIATELVHLVRRARSELSKDPVRDLKLGMGGIREAEFFVQALQLVWGGKDPSLRHRPTLLSLGRLESQGLCTQREAADISDGYLLLRRVEHAVQFGSGVQTHDLPRGADLERIATVLGFSGGGALEASLDDHRERIARRLSSLLPEGEDPTPRWAEVLDALDGGDAALLSEALSASFAPSSLRQGSSSEGGDDAALALSANLLALGKHPDAILGVRTRESYPGLAETLLDALFEAADPSQAVRYLRFFFDRVRQPAVYVRLVFADPAALRRLVGVLGASAFVGDALCNNPELGDMVLFSRGALSEEAVRAEVAAAAEGPRARSAGARGDEHRSPAGRRSSSEAEPRFADEDPEEAFVGGLRLAKTRLTLDVALADLSGELPVRDVNRLLSALADASLEAATRRALGGAGGLSVIAMGKLGGREISYGSDLDVIFVFDPEAAPDPLEASSHFTRAARKIIRYISTFHGAGPGYELDTRLRPSGNQGLLVTSIDAFAKYHAGRAAVWEKMALVRARPAAGDAALGARVLELAHAAAFGDPPELEGAKKEMARIRERVEREGSAEKNGVYDIKLGRGGLLDIEFVVQFLQIAHGPSLPEAARSPETPAAARALVACGVLDEARGRALVDAYDFLRHLELRVRVQRGDASHVLDPRSAGLPALARRMNMRDHPARSAPDALLEEYRVVSTAVRRVFDETFGTG